MSDVNTTFAKKTLSYFVVTSGVSRHYYYLLRNRTQSTHKKTHKTGKNPNQIKAYMPANTSKSINC